MDERLEDLRSVGNEEGFRGRGGSHGLGLGESLLWPVGVGELWLGIKGQVERGGKALGRLWWIVLWSERLWKGDVV
jgi:hypothetical protein